MSHEPSGPFITSMIELKLDANTMFEWQRHSQSSIYVPHYTQLLEFIDLRAQASEANISDAARKPFMKIDTSYGKKSFNSVKPVASFAASAGMILGNCVACKSEKHPL